jgi:Na+-driven multidrug efflux pump
VLQVPDEILPEARKMIMWILPSIFLRVIADNFKTFNLNLGFLKRTGYVMGFNLIPYAIVSYLLVGYYNLGSMGIGIALAFYELTSIVSLYFRVYRTVVEPKYKDTSVPIGHEFGSYFCQSFRMVLTRFPRYIIWSCV